MQKARSGERFNEANVTLDRATTATHSRLIYTVYAPHAVCMLCFVEYSLHYKTIFTP
jgi:hypothetical protein